jgi:hypothetical protein
MKIKYYGFNGSTLEEIGEFITIAEALEHAETIGDFFYITSLDEWVIFAGEIINTLRKK